MNSNCWREQLPFFIRRVEPVTEWMNLQPSTTRLRVVRSTKLSYQGVGAFRIMSEIPKIPYIYLKLGVKQAQISRLKSGKGWLAIM